MHDSLQQIFKYLNTKMLAVLHLWGIVNPQKLGIQQISLLTYLEKKLSCFTVEAKNLNTVEILNPE